MLGLASHITIIPAAAMIVIKKIENHFWRNRFAAHPLLLVHIDPGAALAWRFGALDGAVRKVMAEKYPLLATADANTTATEFLAAICMSMQQEKFTLPPATHATATQFGFAARDSYYASVTASHAVNFLNALIKNPNRSARDVALATAVLEDKCEASALDQSVRAMIAEAEKRGIPWFRPAQNFRDVQFGQGHKQQRMRETITSNEGLLAVSYSRDKAMTCQILGMIGLPVGHFARVTTPDEAAHHAKAMGFPVVLKPLSAGKGVDVLIGLANADAVKQAAKQLLARMPQLLVQSYLPGDDHRLLVVAGRFIAAARREPAFVTGDGKRSIEQLVAEANRDPRRGRYFYKLMNHILIDDEMKDILARQGLSLSNIPPAGAKIKLRLTANISRGGTAIDVTDIIHPDNIRLAERAASAVGLKVAGIDFLTPDISRSWREIGGGICEINASVGLRAHWLSNPKRDVVGPIFDTIFPPGENGRIPTAMITGSNGKTTTTRMLDHIFRAAGHVSGCVTTDGVTVNGDPVVDGDITGPNGASIVLRDATVTAAALETARGGMVKIGIGLDQCDVAALLNVEDEQIGIDGIDTLDQMAALKRGVIETARQKVVLNAEDRRCLEIARDFPADYVILFSLDPSAKALKPHYAAGGAAVTLKKKAGRETIVIEAGGKSTSVIAVDAMPAAFDGIVRHNVANALAAAALAHGFKIPVKTIAEGLAAFTPSFKDSAGRFNIVDDLPARVLFDFAHNAPALVALMKSIGHFKKTSRSICAITCPGNRLDDQIDNCAKAVAGHFDYYVCFDRVEWRRGREPGGVAGRFADTIAAAGVGADRIFRALTQDEAMQAAAGMAKPGDFIAVLGTDARVSMPQIRKSFDATPNAARKKAGP